MWDCSRVHLKLRLCSARNYPTLVCDARFSSLGWLERNRTHRYAVRGLAVHSLCNSMTTLQGPSQLVPGKRTRTT